MTDEVTPTTTDTPVVTPEVKPATPIQVDPPKTDSKSIGTYVGWGALALAVAGVWFFTNPKAPEPVVAPKVEVVAPKEVVATPEQVDAAVKADAKALNEEVVFDRNVQCNLACIKLNVGYTLGVWKNACHCLYGD